MRPRGEIARGIAAPGGRARSGFGCARRFSPRFEWPAWTAIRRFGAIPCAFSLLALGVAGATPVAAFALDSAKTSSPGKIAVQTFTSVQQALQAGVHDLLAGDAQSSVQALTYAADGGQPLAQWKLGRMYARGDGVPRDDVEGLRLFRASRRKLQRRRSRPARHRRDLQRFRRGRRLLPQRHSQQRNQARSGARAGDVPVRGDEFRRSGRAVQSRAHVHGRRGGPRAQQHARGALAGARRRQGPSSRAGAARPLAVPRRGRAAPTGARPDVADASPRTARKAPKDEWIRELHAKDLAAASDDDREVATAYLSARGKDPREA